MGNILENLIVFGAIGLALVFLAKKWFGKNSGSCGCGCDCPASKGGEGCSNETGTRINDLRQK